MKNNVQTLPSGKKRVRVTIGGKRRSFTADTVKEAKAMAARALVDYERNIKPAAASDVQTVGDIVDKYINSRSNVLSVSTVRNYRNIKNDRFPDLMKKKITDVQPDEWQLHINAEAARVGSKTIKNAWSLVRSALVYSGYPAPAVRLPQIIKTESSFLTPEQIKIFLKAVNGDPVELPALLALHSLRRSEICALKWSQIDLTNNVIHVAGALLADENNKYVRQEQNKNQTSRRTVPIMIPRLREILAQRAPYASADEYLYNGSPDTIRNGIKRICRNTNGLPEDITTHSLRHSFASLAYSLGLNELTTMQLGGWSDFGTMRRIYTHLAEQDLNNAVSKLADFYNE